MGKGRRRRRRRRGREEGELYSRNKYSFAKEDDEQRRYARNVARDSTADFSDATSRNRGDTRGFRQRRRRAVTAIERFNRERGRGGGRSELDGKYIKRASEADICRFLSLYPYHRRERAIFPFYASFRTLDLDGHAAAVLASRGRRV